MGQIETKSNKADRKITVDLPECLTLDTVEDLVSSLGADVMVNKVKAQLTVDFRSKIRSMMESLNEDDNPKYSDEDIIGTDFDGWTPEARTRKTPEEKAMETLGALDVEALKKVLADAEAMMEA